MKSSEETVQISREVLLRALRGISSSMKVTKQAAQRKLEALEVQATDEFGIQLIKCAIDPFNTLEITSSACRTLEQFIRRHWSLSSNEYIPPEIRSESKAKIKRDLLVGLCASNSKLTYKAGITTVASSISVIAEIDWLESWPEIFEVLIEYLTDESESAKIGSIYVLESVTLHLTEAQAADVGPAILEEMYRLFEDHESSAFIRKKTIEIFTSIVTCIDAYKQPEKMHHKLKPVIAMFCAKFPESLRMENDVTNYEAGLTVTIHIVETIRQLIKKFPKSIFTFLPKILPVTWEILSHGAKFHRDRALNVKKEKIPARLVCAISKLLRAIMDTTNKPLYCHRPRCRLQDSQWFHLQDSIPLEMLHHFIIFVEITDTQIDSWKYDLSKFVNENRNICRPNPHTVRQNAQKTLLKIVQCRERVALNALCDVILNRTEAGNAMRVSSESGERQNWWRLHEASIQVFGIMKDFIIAKEKAGTLSFDVAGFLQNVVSAHLNDSEIYPFLIGRCLYIGGLYAEQMPKELMPKFLESTINGLTTKSVYARTLAAQAASLWLRAACSEGINIESYLPALFHGLFDLGSQFMTAVDLTIVLESFAALASLNKAFTVSVESSIYGLTFAALTHFSDNSEVCNLCKTVFSELAQNPECIKPLVMRLVPSLVCRLAVTQSKNSGKEQVYCDTFDVLNHLVQHSPQPLSNLLIQSAFPASCRVLNSFEYRTLLRGSHVIRTFLSVAAQQVLGFKDSDGKTGSQCILQIAAHLFSSQASPSFSKVLKQHELIDETIDKVASDIVTLLLKNHTLQEDINPLMKGVLGRIDKVFIPTDIRSLLMVYVRTMNANFDAVFSFLSTTPHELGKQSALAIVISGWCKQLENFECEGRKLVAQALCRILVYGVTHQDSPLRNITFQETAKGEGKVTTSIPILIKISKILSREILRTVTLS